jgi:6,7-dimethyl-8-ribityllumazine synthase
VEHDGKLTTHSHRGPGPPSQANPPSSTSQIIDPLVTGAKAKLLAAGVREENIHIESVPGSWELPIAVQRLYSASQIQSAQSAPGSAASLLMSAGDLLGASTSSTDLTKPAASSESASTASTAAFDAIIAIGVLIKGETMHFEYIAESVSHALMRVQLDTSVPLIFGLLTVLNEEQAKARAGIVPGMHNHGDDWGNAAVELGVKNRLWKEGKI